MSPLNYANKVLFIAQLPETIDFSDPVLPFGFNAAKTHDVIAATMLLMRERGLQAHLFFVQPDHTAAVELRQYLTGKSYDCVVIGAGIRMPLKSLLLFETIVNIVHHCAPGASIAFNTNPMDTVDAAQRRLRTRVVRLDA